MEELNSAATSNSSSTPGPLPDSPLVDSRGVLPAVILSLCFLVGLPGNIAVIILKPNFQQLSSMTQNLMLNLAVSDLICLLTLPLWIYSLLYSWIFGLLACKILAYLVYCSVYGSFLTIVLLSFQRYMLVVHQKSWDQTKRRLLVVLLWLVAMILSIPLTRSPQRIDQLCMVMFIAEIIWGFIIMFIVAFSYICLYRKLKQAVFFNNPQTTTLVISITVTFFVLYFPYHVNNILTVIAFYLKNKGLMKICYLWWYISIAIVSLNSSVNPYLYALTSCNFRKCVCAENCDCWSTNSSVSQGESNTAITNV
uniref:G-protein coupled receptors family 1 profile domain-containing protein n=1 Tax=Oryzias latipes TaxID=8090 RepID=A0A3P9JZZ0_ORYLA